MSLPLYWLSLSIAVPLIWLLPSLAVSQSSLPLSEEQYRSTESRGFQSLEDYNFFDSDYILAPGDRINITVYGYEEFNLVQEILPDGTITLPLLGSVRVTGYTNSSLDNELTTRLDEGGLVEPDVTVSLNEQRPIVVSITGSVRRPEPTQLEKNSATLSSAIAQAGGVSRDANIREVVIARTLPDGQNITARFDLWDLVWSDNLLAEGTGNDEAERLVLRDGDKIFVPQTTRDANLDQSLVARSSFAPDTVKVRVVGEVRRPGEIQVSPDTSLSGAISSAGGPTSDAVLERVEFIRLNENGEIERREIDLQSLTDNVQVQDGDLLLVPKSGITSFGDKQNFIPI